MIPELIQASKGENSGVRLNALSALVEIGPEAVPALIQLLEDQDRDLRLDVTKALGEISIVPRTLSNC